MKMLKNYAKLDKWLVTLMIDGKNERKNVEGIIEGIIKVLV